jgi:5-methylcytosine-specific restriction endonuclease McrA
MPTFCGAKCQGAAATERAVKVLQCKGCSKTFTMIAYRKLFCSPKCRYAYERDRACSGCGATITTNSPRQKWCADCEGTYRRDQLVRAARQGWDRLDYDLRNAYADLVRKMPCTYCGCSPDGVVMHADHAIPLSRGGSDAWHNLAPACEPCNLRKHTKTPEEFLASLRR